MIVDPGKRSAKTGAVLLMLAAFLVPALLPVELPAHTQQPPTEEEKRSFGLAERLGEKIPLDLPFRDESGQEVRLAQLVTGPTLILPVYYGCTNVCNFMQGGLASALPGVKGTPGKDYRVLSISIDDRETPAQAARARRIHLGTNKSFPEDGWRFLTGPAGSIRQLTDAAGYRFMRKGKDFLHPVASFVVSRDGTIVRYLYGTSFLPKDLTLALLEAREGRIGASVRTVVGYCFTYDPAGKTYVFNILRVSATVVIVTAGGFLLFLILTGRNRKNRNEELSVKEERGGISSETPED